MISLDDCCSILLIFGEVRLGLLYLISKAQVINGRIDLRFVMSAPEV